MQIRKKKQEKPANLPRIAELWEHRSLDGTYMRVGDNASACFNLLDPSDYFYSVNLETGLLFYTSIYNTEGIIILKQKSPLDLEPA